MSFIDWLKTTRKECSQWAEFFSLIAGDANPAASFTAAKATEWQAFLSDRFSATAQARMVGLTDESLRGQAVRGMQSLLDLEKRLRAATEAQAKSEMSQLMLGIDAALQRLGIALNRVRPTDVDEAAAAAASSAAEPTPPAPAKVPTPEADAPRAEADARRSAGVPRRRPTGEMPSVPPPPPPSPAPRPPRPATSPSLPAVTAEATPGSGGVKAAKPPTGPVPRLDISMPAPAAPVRPPASSALAAPRFRSVPSSPGERPAPPAATPAPAAATPVATPPPRFKPVRTSEDPVIELTQKKGDSALIKLPIDAPPVEAARPVEPTPVRPPARSAGPLRPAEIDSRVALLKTYVRRLDREVLGPEEEAALAQVVAILSGALSSDEDALARRLRYLDQQFAADDASLFSRPVLDDLRALLGTLAAEAVERLRHACDQAQADRLLFVVDPPEVWDTPAGLAVVKLAVNPRGLRSGLLPTYLPRLRGPAVGFTFHAGVREGAALVRRIPENRLEIGFVAGPSRLWLTALHVLRSGAGLSIEQGGDDVPAYFEARLALPATEETHAVTQRFVLAEVARFVDRVAVA